MSVSNNSCWLFDLDNTLYSPYSEIFPRIHERMQLYIMDRFGASPEEADHLRFVYFKKYGTTLAGLMAERKIDPQDFLDYVHDVPLDSIAPDPRINRALSRLPGRKIIFTNADKKHARRILAHLGLTTYFEAIFDITDSAFVCKPETAAYQALLDRYGLPAGNCWMVDDMERNLHAAAQLGMTTVWLRHEAPWLRVKPGSAESYPHCHHVTEDLTHFLEEILDAHSIKTASG